MLDVDAVHAYYGESHILQGITLGAEAGRVTAVLGRNGVGKTTLMRAIVGFTPPRGGAVTFAGRPIARLSPEKIARLGIALVPQGRRIFGSLTVEENLRVGTLGGRTGRWNLSGVYEIFPRLRDRRENFGGQLSGGEQQMLAIGRALMANPELLLMDEPTEGLAPLIVREVGRVIATLKETGLGIVLVEQNLPLALSLADTTYVISKGVVVHHCTPEELRRDEATRIRYLGV